LYRLVEISFHSQIQRTAITGTNCQQLKQFQPHQLQELGPAWLLLATPKRSILTMIMNKTLKVLYSMQYKAHFTMRACRKYKNTQIVIQRQYI